jgi:hypothetical protein
MNPGTVTDAATIVIAPGATGVDLTPYHDELVRLSLPGRLAAKLGEIDKARRLNRIFVMGCGRSGTWLVTGVMSTFADVCVVGDEVPVETFGILSSSQSALVLKRAHDSFAKIKDVPEEIGIAYIIRHPFDVLTSHHPNNKRRFHVLPDRWLGEMRALQFLVQTKRPRTKIVRYEDLVRDPTAVQGALGTAFELKAMVPAGDFMASFTPSPKRPAAVDCMREIDTNAVGRYKKDRESIEHLKGIRPMLEPLLDWVATEFEYELSL